MISRVLPSDTEKHPVRSRQATSAAGACMIHAIGTVVMLLILGFVLFVYGPSLRDLAIGLLVGSGLFAFYALLFPYTTPAAQSGTAAKIIGVGAFAAAVILFALSSANPAAEGLPELAVIRKRPWLVLAMFIALALYSAERTLHFFCAHRSGKNGRH